MELLLTIALAALLMSIAVPSFISINKGASAKQADNMVQAMLRQGQQESIVNRQRVAFGVVTTVLNSNNQWVAGNMANRAYFLYASDSSDAAKPEGFLTPIQMLPAPMMFDFASSAFSTNIPLRTMYSTSGTALFEYRAFRFAPGGGVYMPDADGATSRRFDIVIREGLMTAGGNLASKTNGPVIGYTNAVNVYTGRVFRP